MYERGGYPIGGRYGIWGINPYGQPVVQTPGIQTAIKTAEGIGNLFAKRYANQEAEAKARLAQGTVDSEIAAKNAMNEANQQYYPLQEMFKTQQEQEKIKEIMARTGLSYAQAKHALASAGAENARAGLYVAEAKKSDPTLLFDKINSELRVTPVGTPRYNYLRGLLNTMISSSGPLPVMTNGRGVSTSALGGMFPAKNATGINPQGMQMNPLQGGSRSGFHQAATVDANGNPITVESPTMSSATRNQMRKEAEAEANYIIPAVNKGLNTYKGVSPTLSALFDTYAARYGSPQEREAARQRLLDLSIAKRFVPEVASINARQATGQPPGIEVLREFKQSMFPNNPNDFVEKFIPGDIQAQAANTYPELQKELANQAITQSRTGYPEEGAPGWANQNPFPNGFIDDQGKYVTPEETAKMFAPKEQAAPQNPIVNQINTMGEQAVAAGVAPEVVRDEITMAQQAIAQGIDPSAVMNLFKQRAMGGR